MSMISNTAYAYSFYTFSGSRLFTIDAEMWNEIEVKIWKRTEGPGKWVLVRTVTFRKNNIVLVIPAGAVVRRYNLDQDLLEMNYSD